MSNYRPHPKDGEGNIFTLCVSTHLDGGGGGGRGVSHHRSGQGGTPLYPGLDGEYPIPGVDGGGTPQTGRDGVPHLARSGWWRGTPLSAGTGWGGIPGQDWMGYPPRTGLGTPPPPLDRAA